ncbi:MAG: cell wall hydrolase [Clostridia bacterium]|nr:cell wall hydrolase [Clostridia bacterium]
MKKIFCFFCFFCLLFVMILLLTTSVFAADTYNGYNIPIDIEVNGHFINCTQKPIIINGTTYIPLRVFSDAIGGSILWDEVNRVAVMEKDGHSFSFDPDENRCVIDGAATEYGVVLYENLTFIPVRAVSETLGYEVLWDDCYLTVKITAPNTEIPEVCRDYSYTYEDMLYLGKIVQIEGGYQPFEAKLGVAGTVMNRVKSPKFPNAVKSVIFDTKYGVQFPPVHTSKIDVTPTKDTMIAAKCALGGVQVVGDSLYFIDTKAAPNSWAHNNRPYYATLGGMNFYE